MLSRWLFESQATYMLLIELLLGGAVVVVAGSKLTRLADEVAEALNLGKAWIGMVLLATVTSLPELVTGTTAVTIEPPNTNMAFGNILGSNCFNVAIIVLLNAVLRQGSVLRDAQPTTTLAVSCGIVLTAILVLAFAVTDRFAAHGYGFVNKIEWLAAGFIAVTYLALMRALYRFDKRLTAPVSDELAPRPEELRRLYTRCAIAALVIVAAGYWLTLTGDLLAVQPIQISSDTTIVLGGTFVGAFFLAIATSLPEIVTGIAAVRMGKLDLALGNLFGSNMFNVFVTPFLKIASAIAGGHLLMTELGPEPLSWPSASTLTSTRPGPVPSELPAHFFDLTRNVMTGALAILLMGIALASVTYRSRRRLYFFGFDSVVIALVYLGGMYLLLQGMPSP